MKPKTTLIAAALLLLAGGLVYAQMQPQSAPVAPGEAGMQAPGPRGNPPAEGAMHQISKDVQRKIMQQRIKFTRDNAQLRVDIEVARMELEALWLADEPSADDIIAKMRDLDKLELQLRENEVRNRLAISKLMPEGMKMGGPGMMHGDRMGMPGPGRNPRGPDRKGPDQGPN